MGDIDVAALRARAIEQQAQCDKQTAIDPVVTGVWLRSRFRPVANPAVVLELLDRLAAAEGAVARVRSVRALIQMWADEAEKRGPADQINTAGVVAMLAHAIKEQP